MMSAENNMVETKESALFPTYARFPLTFVRGQGSTLWDDQGNAYLDLMSGIAVCNLGHVPQRVKERLLTQLEQLWHVSNLFHIPQQECLAQLLTKNSSLDLAFFCNSGAEANEAAIKLARRHQQKVRGRERYEIITFQQSFHGRTLATLTATGQDKVKDGFQPLPAGFLYAEYNDSESVRALISERTAAIMLEAVQGEGGVRPADAQFIADVVALCREHELLLIVDEIQSGIGRTGKWFAYEHYGIEPDIVTLAKGLGSGVPIGAMLGKKELAEAFAAGSHGSTFGGNPLAAAAAVATIDTLMIERLPERAAELGEWAVAFLRERLAAHPQVVEVRGKGLMLGIECTVPVAPWIAQLQALGVLVISAGPNVIRLLPALTVTRDELASGLERLCEVLNTVSV
jgi:acetylornithine/N-succinyldiaminopimelate aminotransferase